MRLDENISEKMPAVILAFTFAACMLSLNNIHSNENKMKAVAHNCEIESLVDKGDSVEAKCVLKNPRGEQKSEMFRGGSNKQTRSRIGKMWNHHNHWEYLMTINYYEENGVKVPSSIELKPENERFFPENKTLDLTNKPVFKSQLEKVLNRRINKTW